MQTLAGSHLWVLNLFMDYMFNLYVLNKHADI